MLSHRRVLIPILLAILTLTAHAQSPREARSRFERGRERFSKGDLDGAIADFSRAIVISQHGNAHNLPQPQSWAGDAYLARKEASLGQIVFVDLLTAAAYANRGLARYRKGDWEGAIVDCDRALAINPGLDEAYSNRGAIRWAMGDLDGALTDLDQAIRTNSHSAQAFDNRGNVRSLKGDAVGALADFEQAVSLSPERAEFYCDRGQARLRLGHERALADFERAIQLNPRLALTYYSRGTFWYAKHDLNRAMVDFNRAIELDSAYSIAYMLRGFTRSQLGQNGEAEKDLEVALKFDPTLKPTIAQFAAKQAQRSGQALNEK
jgi:tetratricopeptide (TPR) repeat protein